MTYRRRRGEKKVISDYWLEHYIPHGHCMLCGNSGKIDTTGRAYTAAGLHVGGIAFCICPNGQLMRYSSKKKPA